MTPERFHKLRRTLSARQPDLTVIMENVHKSHNIGAIVRTCDAVGILDLHAVSPDGEVRRHHMVSGGTRRYVRTRLHPDIDTAVAHVKASGHRVLAAHLSEDPSSRNASMRADAALALSSPVTSGAMRGPPKLACV